MKIVVILPPKSGKISKSQSHYEGPSTEGQSHHYFCSVILVVKVLKIIEYF